MKTYTQPALFPITDLVVTGRPKPWPADELDATSPAVVGTDEPPTAELPQADALFDVTTLDAA
ncbi:hypothetical protein GCM10011583_18530 [Streptomyces camponoticapitis]|uniref:ATP-grasp-modified RiPP n=1 Tax=Streptomyces camponoticapitis TaxID=1616125 RepID=A0ABQ2E259_9ACTN|nr:hypothetical protein [Streptomyces camponoticapitis]GGJ87286.1 hypothetical protein GCM10011583_18530 [Streptomyces camponoticapitis]